MKKEQKYLVCSLADRPTTVRGASFNHVCSRCLSRVMMAPSGQKFLKENPFLVILCLVCVERDPKFCDATSEHVPAASPEDFVRELLDTIPNLRRQRN